MPKLDLDKSYRYQGSVYGPGKDLEVPEAVAQVVRASQPQEPAATEPSALEPASSPKTDEPFAVDGVDADTMEALRAAGFDSAEKIKAATDEQLRDVKGVGVATFEKLRAI